MKLWRWAAALAVFLVVACVPTEARQGAATSSSSVPASATRAEAGRESDHESWRKPRYISVAEAVRRLQPHIDLPILLPSDRLAGLRSFKGWLADPKQVDWHRQSGSRVGSMQLVKKEQILFMEFGYSSFDGCGGRDTAIETNVDGEPALISTVAGQQWSQLIWPVTATGSTGRYGLAGTFEGWELVRLAESMDDGTGLRSSADRSC